MGIGSFLGTLLTPVLGPVAPAAGALFDGFTADRRANKQSKQIQQSSEKAAEADRANQVRDRENMFSDLRRSAVKGGFNPLTALRATGGAGFGSGSSSSGVIGQIAPLATIEGLTRGFDTAATYLDGSRQREVQRQELEDELTRAQIDNLRNPVPLSTRRAAAVSVSNVSTSPQSGPSDAEDYVTGVPVVGPRARPDLWSKGSVPVIGPDGGNMQIPRSVAERLKLDAWDVLIAEDYEALFGEQVGQAVALPKMGASVIQIEGGVTTNRSVEERQEILANPNDPVLLGPQWLQDWRDGRKETVSNANQGSGNRRNTRGPQPSIIVGAN